jgi:hypothetical protein
MPPAFKLTKAELAERNRLAQAARAALDRAQVAVADYDAAVTACLQFARTIAGRWREQHDERSARWQRGRRGETVDAFIQQWEDFQPDETDQPDDSTIAEFEALPETVERRE